MVVLRVFKIMVRVVSFHLPSRVMTRASGVEGGASWALRWSNRHRRDALGHKRRSPYALCPIFSPLKTFLWIVNVRMTKLKAWMLPSVSVTTKTMRHQLKEFSLS